MADEIEEPEGTQAQVVSFDDDDEEQGTVVT